ncbi:hypothetical protein AK812_SmicGene25206 [Symbiodinium microadriaticum]|uniref:Uncharacterized protein n=1 Tax=Symbiodinium microadriaticum TaxID=2951 RepID=A0A1Q9DCU3_SYMMI|nr:hypothetical protein AK812_SmicGene25206 [Symbiodinium microadriaticum]
MELSLVTDGKATRCFEPCGAFKGAKPGWVFKTGGQGLGYYLDALDDSFEQSGQRQSFRQSKQETSYLFELAPGPNEVISTDCFPIVATSLVVQRCNPKKGTTMETIGPARHRFGARAPEPRKYRGIACCGCKRQRPGEQWLFDSKWQQSVMHALITAQADVNAKDEMQTTFNNRQMLRQQQTSLLRLVAVAENETELPRSLKLLSHFGDNLHHLDEKRNTALHQAVAGCRPGVLDFLVNRGVDPELHNADGALQRLLKPKGNQSASSSFRSSRCIDVHELAESGAAPFKKKQESGSAKDPMQLLKQYGFGVFWLMCVSITVFEYILDSQILAEQYCPVLAAIFERGVFASWR